MNRWKKIALVACTLAGVLSSAGRVSAELDNSKYPIPNRRTAPNEFRTDGDPLKMNAGAVDVGAGTFWLDSFTESGTVSWWCFDEGGPQCVPSVQLTGTLRFGHPYGGCAFMEVRYFDGAGTRLDTSRKSVCTMPVIASEVDFEFWRTSRAPTASVESVTVVLFQQCNGCAKVEVGRTTLRRGD